MLGCAFHIVRDEELSHLLNQLSRVLRPGGLVLANDLLPLISHVNQFSRDGRFYNKVVRSRRRWRKIAQSAGLRARFVTNHAWFRAPGRIPEGHIVCLAASGDARSDSIEVVPPAAQAA